MCGSVLRGRRGNATLLEALDESWQQGLCNEVVYLPEPLFRFGDGVNISDGVSPAEIYLKGDGWIEVELILEGDRDAYYLGVIRNGLNLHDSPQRDRKAMQVNLTSVRGDSPV